MRSDKRFDVALALGVACLGQIDVWGPQFAGANVAGPRPVVSACYLFTALALVWRRSHPVAVAAAIGLVDIAQWLAFGASSGNGTLLPAVVALYSVGAYRPPRFGVGAVALGAGVLFVHELTNPNLPSERAVLRASAWDVVILGSWLVGAYVRTRRLYIAELRERAARAEREHAERARAAVLEERAHIARELHDAVAHGVSVMVVQAEAGEEVLDRDREGARRALRQVQRSGREALVEMRRLVGLLRTDEGRVELAPAPGLADLEDLLERVRVAGQPVELQVDGKPVALPAGIDQSAYRIVQEALTNVLKHAAATHALVHLVYDQRELALEVTDDGRGPAHLNGNGHGIAGMRERTSLYGGEFEAGPAAPSGFRIRAVLPVGRT